MYFTSEQCNAIIDALQEKDILEWLVKSAGAQIKRETPDHIWMTTVCHGGDSGKLCYFRQTKTFYCYTNCGYMNLYRMAMNVLDCEFPKAVQLFASMAHINVRNALGVSRNDTYTNDLERCKRRRKGGRNHKREPNKLSVVDPVVMSCFAPNTFYTGWRDEGISALVMRDFGIAWDELRRAVIIPHRDTKGNIVGIRRRCVDEDVGAKYLPLSIGGQIYAHPLGMTLYGMYEHSEAIRKCKQVIVFEGEKSVLKHHTYYGKASNAVAVCGFNITPVQRDMLLGTGIEEIILAFDKDVLMYGDSVKSDGYARYCQRVNAMGRLFAPYCRTTALVDMGENLDLKDSPIDKGKEVFEYLLQNRVQIHSTIA